MKTIEEIQIQLKNLYNELEEYKKVHNKESEQIDFDEISAISKRYPIVNHKMQEYDEYTQQMYLLMLLVVADIDNNMYSESFSLIYRIAYGMNFQGNIKNLFVNAKTLNFAQLDEITRLFADDDVKLLLITECMMIAVGFEKGKKDAYQFISRLCVLLKISKEQLVFTSNLARVILTDNLQEFKCKIRNTYNVFDCYLGKFKFDRQLIFTNIPSNNDDFSNCLVWNVKQIESKIEFYKEQSLFNLGLVILARNVNNSYVIDLNDMFNNYIFKDGILGKDCRKPIGVQTHFLDTEEQVKLFFEENKDTLRKD